MHTVIVIKKNRRWRRTVLNLYSKHIPWWIINSWGELPVLKYIVEWIISGPAGILHQGREEFASMLLKSHLWWNHHHCIHCAYKHIDLQGLQCCMPKTPQIITGRQLLYTHRRTHSQTQGRISLYASIKSVSRFQEKEKRGEMITINDNIKL